jgi:hypothetical protein
VILTGIHAIGYGPGSLSIERRALGASDSDGRHAAWWMSRGDLREETPLQNHSQVRLEWRRFVRACLLVPQPWAILVAMMLPLSAAAQLIGDNPALEELRQRTPSGAADERIIDDWVKSLFADLDSGSKSTGLATLRTVRSDGATTAAFREKLDERLAVIAKAEFERSDPISVASGDALAIAMIEADDVRTLPGLLAGLKHPASVVRYRVVTGVIRLRDRWSTNPATLKTVVGALKAAGEKEESGVIAERIYAALSLPGSSPEVVDAFAAVLAARTDLYRKGAVFDDIAEEVACLYLSGVTIARDKAPSIVRPLATVLRIDVERYTAGAFVPGQRNAIEKRVDACESLIAKVVNPASGRGHVSREMQAGNTASAIEFELLEWIGSQDSAGVLNKAPWNVPKGAP